MVFIGNHWCGFLKECLRGRQKHRGGAACPLHQVRDCFAPRKFLRHRYVFIICDSEMFLKGSARKESSIRERQPVFGQISQSPVRIVTFPCSMRKASSSQGRDPGISMTVSARTLLRHVMAISLEYLDKRLQSCSVLIRESNSAREGQALTHNPHPLQRSQSGCAP